MEDAFFIGEKDFGLFDGVTGSRKASGQDLYRCDWPPDVSRAPFRGAAAVCGVSRLRHEEAGVAAAPPGAAAA